jgi:subtilase family serine protease
MFIKSAPSLMTVLFLTAVTAGFCADPARKTLHDHVPPIVAQLVPQGDLPESNHLSLAIGLPLRNQPALGEFLRQLYDPHSTNFHQFLTPAEFTARFGPTEADYQAVQSFARDNGFQITGTHGNRLLLDVRANVKDIQRALHIQMRKFRHPRENRNFFAPDSEPSVAATLPIADISGLNDFELPHPKLVKRDSMAAKAVAQSGSAPDGEFLGDDFRAAYVPDTTLTGAGQVVGLLQFDGFYARDVAAYAQAAGGGRASIPIQTVLVDGYNGVPHSGNDEVALDIEMAMAMAPGLSKIIVFSGGPNGLPNDILNAMAASNAVKNLSCCWGWDGGPSTTTDAIFQQMAAQGQSFFNASGDSGAFTTGANSVNGVDNASQANAPSSSPYITQVGGTTLATTGPGGAWQSETAWYDSSGGISSYYAIPTWQIGVNMSGNQGSTTQRNIPDVALVAANVYCFSDNGGAGSVSGTSCAAPLWAGLTALMNQQAAQNGKSPVGLINAAVYAAGASANYAQDFHDITSGNNTSGVSPSQFFAVAGYDLCTGWGTPAGQRLIDALTTTGTPVTVPQGTLEIVSNPQLTATGAVGGPFNPATSSITLINSGTAPLTWALANPNAVSWLKVTPAGGTLNALAGTNLIVSFTTAAANLAPGNYSASFNFTDLTSSPVQTVTFQLLVTPQVSVQPLAGFNASGTAGGPFTPATQSFTIANLSGSPVPWKIMKSIKWLTIKPSSGTVAAGSQAIFTLALNTKANKLTAATYNSTLTVLGKKNKVLQILPVTLNVSASFVATAKIQSVGQGHSAIEFTVSTTNGTVYQEQSTTNLLQPVWINMGGPVTAASDSLKFTDPNTGNFPQKFYRLMVVPGNPTQK